MITVFFGKDSFRSREAFRAARAAAAQAVGVEPVVLRDDTLTPATLLAAVDHQPLFGQVPPLAVERLTAFTGSAAEAVARALRTVPGARTVLCWEEDRPAVNGVVWRALVDVGDLEEFSPLDEAAASAWIRRRARAAGGTIEAPAVRALLAACGLDLWCLASELDKLLVSSRTAITETDVDALAPSRESSDLFETVRAVVSGDPATALRFLVAYRRTGGEPRRLFALVVRELRMLLRIRDGLDRGERLTSWELARELGLPRFVAERLVRTARETTTEAVRALFDRCAVAYYHLNTGQASAEEVLESLLLVQVGGAAARFAPERRATKNLAG